MADQASEPQPPGHRGRGRNGGGGRLGLHRYFDWNHSDGYEFSLVNDGLHRRARFGSLPFTGGDAALGGVVHPQLVGSRLTLNGEFRGRERVAGPFDAKGLVEGCTPR